MIHVSNLNLFTLGRRHAFESWPGRYIAPESGAAPSLVLDFERDEYRALGLRKPLGELVAFTRGSTETGVDQQGNPLTFEPNVPVIDWMTGRKGIYLSRSEGARPADQLALLPGAWFQPAACSLFLEGTLLQLYGPNNRIADFNGDQGISRLSVLVNGSGRIGLQVWSSGTLQASFSKGDAIPTDTAIDLPFRICCTAQENNFGVSLNGDQTSVATSGVMPQVSQFDIGSSFNGLANPKLVLHKLVVFDYALSATAAASFAP